MPSGEKKIFLFWFGSIRLYISIASMLFASLIGNRTSAQFSYSMWRMFISNCYQIVELHHVLERFWLFEHPYLQAKVRKLPLVLLQKMPLRFGCVYSKPNASLADSHGVKNYSALFCFCIYDHVKTSVGEV